MSHIVRRLAVPFVLLATFAWSPVAEAAGTPLQVVTVAGTAYDDSPLDATGNEGPCALAVAASREDTGAAGDDQRASGSGSFTAAGGTGANTGRSVCEGFPASLRFTVVRFRVVGPTTVELTVRLTASDDPLTPVGTEGTILVFTDTEFADFTVGRHHGGFGPGRRRYSDFISTLADVRFDRTAAATMTHYSATGTAVDTALSPLTARGDCVVAVAGTTSGSGRLGSGSYQATAGLTSPPACSGGAAIYAFDVDSAATDGEATATAAIHGTDSYVGTPPPAGVATIDETTQQLTFAAAPYGGVFGPGHTTRPAGTALVDTRAGADVSTQSYPIRTPIVLGPGGVPVQVVAASGTALDTAPVTAGGTRGPCAVAVAASRELFAGPGSALGGSGSFIVSRGEGPTARLSVCGGGTPISLRFDVVGFQLSGSTATLDVVIVYSDDPAADPVGAHGTIVADAVSDRVDVSFPFYTAGFGPGQAAYGSIATDADVRLGEGDAVSVTHFSGTGTAIDAQPTLASTQGDCAAAVAGTTSSASTVGGGTFLAVTAMVPRSNCVGGNAAFRYSVLTAATDGVSKAALVVRVDGGTAGPPGGSEGRINLDETTQTTEFDIPPSFGRFVDGGLFGTNLGALISTRAGARVDSVLYLPASTACFVTGGGFIGAKANFGFEAHSNGGPPLGNLVYDDRAAGVRVKATELESLVCSGTHAILRGRGTTSTGVVDFRVDVDDAGEPGRNDTFAIQLSNGYAAGGTLVGGNVQLHR